MNDKGFTLVELLAVIIILSGIGLLAVSGITSSLERQEEKKVESQKEMSVNSAKIYFSLEEGDTVCISDLVSFGYLDEKDVSDVANGCVKKSNSGYQYEENCSCS